MSLSYQSEDLMSAKSCYTRLLKECSVSFLCHGFHFLVLFCTLISMLGTDNLNFGLYCFFHLSYLFPDTLHISLCVYSS